MIRVRYIGPIFERSGYGVAATENCRALLRAGIDLEVVPPRDVVVNSIPERYHELIPHVNCNSHPDFSWPTHVVVHAIPAMCIKFKHDMAAYPATTKKIAYTTWEYNGFPPELAVKLKCIFDLTLVPCEWNRVQMQNASMQNIQVMPHAFDPIWWCRMSRAEHRRRKNDSTYIFYTVCTWTQRKNPLGLLKAYFAEFTVDDDVLLRLVTPSWNAGEIRGLIRSTGFTLETLPRIEFVGDQGYLTDEAYREVHFSSDCFVSASRGEGWGLGAFEASLYNPIIVVPQYGAAHEYFSIVAGYNRATSLKYSLTPVYYPPTIGEPLASGGARPVIEHTHFGTRGDQTWAEPDLHGLAKAMRRAKQRPNYAQSRHACRGRLIDKFSLENVGKKFKNVLQGL